VILAKLFEGPVATGEVVGANDKMAYARIKRGAAIAAVLNFGILSYTVFSDGLFIPCALSKGECNK
jgi:hypothetical protein